MKNPSVIADDQIKECTKGQKSKAVPEAKPGRSGFVRPAADGKKNKAKPCLEIDLTSKESPKPKTVEKIILQGNVKRVTVEKKDGKSGSFKPVLEKVKVDKSGVVRLPVPTKMTDLRVVMEEVRDDSKKVNTTLAVHACGKFPREYHCQPA